MIESAVLWAGDGALARLMNFTSNLVGCMRFDLEKNATRKVRRASLDDDSLES